MTRRGRRAAVSKSSGHLCVIRQCNRTIDLFCGYGNCWCPSGLLGWTGRNFFGLLDTSWRYRFSLGLRGVDFSNAGRGSR